MDQAGDVRSLVTGVDSQSWIEDTLETGPINKADGDFGSLTAWVK